MALGAAEWWLWKTNLVAGKRKQRAFRKLERDMVLCTESRLCLENALGLHLGVGACHSGIGMMSGMGNRLGFLRQRQESWRQSVLFGGFAGNPLRNIKALT